MSRTLSPCVVLLVVATAWCSSRTRLRAGEFPSLDKLPINAELPDPLTMLDGTPVKTRAEWENRRKPELMALFQHYMYGTLPAAPPVTATVTNACDDACGGKAVMKEITLAFGPAECPKIHLLLLVPKAAKKDARPPAVFLGLSFSGNHTVLADKRISLPKPSSASGKAAKGAPAADEGRGSAADRWQVEHVLARGYALATFCYGDVVPDRNQPNDPASVRSYFRKAGQTEPGPTDWGAIAGWAWGVQRAVDWLVTEPSIDGKRIIVFGHSRNGKAALLAAAFDARIAAVIPHQAGCGGTSPSRRQNPNGESVTVINKQFPHWFDAVFKEFNGQEERLPFDQNCLIALCAPRPVLLSCGEQDQWADPPGQFRNLRAARSVYRLYGKEGIADTIEKPEDGQRVGKEFSYYIRDAKHTVDRAYWNAFLEFADAFVGGK